MESQCKDHVALEVRIKRNEDEIRKNQRAITIFRTWVIAGSCSVILQLLIVIFNLIKP